MSLHEDKFVSSCSWQESLYSCMKWLICWLSLRHKANILHLTFPLHKDPSSPGVRHTDSFIRGVRRVQQSKNIMRFILLLPGIPVRQWSFPLLCTTTPRAHNEGGCGVRIFCETLSFVFFDSDSTLFGSHLSPFENDRGHSTTLVHVRHNKGVAQEEKFAAK